MFLLLGIIGLLSLIFTIYSYFFTDKSILLMLYQSKPIIPSAIEALQRSVSLQGVNLLILIFVIVISLFAVFLTITKYVINKKLMIVIIAIPILLAFAYPIVSRDSFSYLYYAKMILAYHQNPYSVSPDANYSFDLWVGFIHNTEQTSRYGTIALLINLIPMAIIGSGKFIVNLFALKLTSLIFFLLGARLFYLLTKNLNLTIILWVLNLFIINEFLVNNHNDLFMIVLFWLAIYLKKNSTKLLSLFAYSLSFSTKYVTGPLLPLLYFPKKLQTFISLAAIIFIVNYLMVNHFLYWYYSWIYLLLPFLKLNKPQILSILFLQLSLVLGYAGFLETGGYTITSNNLIFLISESKYLFIPMFIISTVYPLFINRGSNQRSGQHCEE